MKKTILLKIIALLSVMTVLTSCDLTGGRLPGGTSETEESPTETEAQTEKVPHEVTDETVYRYGGDPDYPVLADAYLSVLPKRNFNGATFIVSSPDVTFLDENEVKYVSKTVKERNDAVEEKYNVKLVSSKVDPVTMAEEAKKAMLAGMYYTNIMCVPFEKVGAFAAEGILMNLRSMPLLDLSQPYFNKTSVAALSAGYNIYGAAGEAVPVYDLPCIIFNRPLAQTVTDTDLYDLAEAGEFTWEKFYSIAQEASALDGYCGAAITGGETIDYVHRSFGEAYINSGELQVPATAIERFSMDWSATYIRRMLKMGADEGITKDTAVSAFNEGSVLFTIGKVGELDLYRNTNVLVGILPLPKRNADWGYRSEVGGDALIMTVPSKSTDSEMNSLIFSALNAASYGYITETAASYLHATTLPDNRSADMLEIISRSAVYEFSTAFLETVPSLAELREVIRGIIETGDFSRYDDAIYKANYDLGMTFRLSN